ncbi:MAG: hypothetical protein M1820_006763 [Bogoriella megaspora]|nr:MAG: hypothetical protein M1820_006763 [Bogoriella megaspora]
MVGKRKRSEASLRHQPESATDTVGGFRVEYKRKTSEKDPKTGLSIPPYEIVPKDRWQALKSRKSLRLATDPAIPEKHALAAVGDVVLVEKGETGSSNQVNVFEQWKGRILEIRANDSSLVICAIAWLQRPLDLPGGPKPYHSRYELISTNHVDVVEATMFNGKIKVEHWDEDNDDAEPDIGEDEDKFFWRQTQEYFSKKLSRLRKHCYCKEPRNPDDLMVQCTNSGSCGKWLHASCLERLANTAASGNQPGNADSEAMEGTPESPGRRSRKRNLPQVAGPSSDVSAEVVSTSDRKGIRIRLTNSAAKSEQPSWEERVFCPCCSALIKDEDEGGDEDEDEGGGDDGGERSEQNDNGGQSELGEKNDRGEQGDHGEQSNHGEHSDHGEPEDLRPPLKKKRKENANDTPDTTLTTPDGAPKQEAETSQPSSAATPTRAARKAVQYTAHRALAAVTNGETTEPKYVTRTPYGIGDAILGANAPEEDVAQDEDKGKFQESNSQPSISRVIKSLFGGAT